ncbi:MAG: cupin domain-containing protein [Aerococcus sp.]|nr:cupin domain-containing protein [Aerococcus sp.]
MTVKNEDVKNGVIFPLGDKNEAYAEYFDGQSYLKMLAADPDITVSVGNVTFEPGCRNHWHIHHYGFQILLVTGGNGWYQEEGQTARALKSGDVVITKDSVKHWHGAQADSWFSHIAISAVSTEWLEPVSDADYAQL